MSGIKTPIQDILTKLTAIQVMNQDSQAVNLYSRIWNNQLKNLEDGKDYVWPRPAAFVEIISPVNFEALGLGIRTADLGIRIHLIHDFYNQDGTFEQDLIIFDLRDQILANYDNPVNPGLSNYCPTGCGPMVCTNESQDPNHDNLYEYILEFVCNFIDSKGSPFDDSAGRFINTADTTMDMSVESGVPAQTPQADYILPVKQY